jgi:thioredoxin reductase (NADPH)
MENWELVIVGGGPAGLAAGIYSARSGLKTVILEEKLAGGTTVDAPVIQNYPGFQSVSGFDLAEKLVTHCKGSGVEIREFEDVSGLDLRNEKKGVRTSKNVYESKAVILATGAHYRSIDVLGEKEFRGRGVSYCGLCDGPLFKGKKVLVVGGGNSAIMTVLYLAGIASKVQVAHRRDVFRAEKALVKDLETKENIEVLWNTEVKEIKGERLVDRAVVFNNKSRETKELSIDGVFVQIGQDPNSQSAKEAGVNVDGYGYIIVDRRQRTNISGVYAAGDVTNHPVKQIGTAVGQGITAAVEAYNYIRKPYYKL